MSGRLQTHRPNSREQIRKFLKNFLKKKQRSIDTAVKAFTSTIYNAMNASSSEISPTNSNRLALPSSTQQLVKERNKARKTWQTSRNHRDKLRLLKLSKDIKYEIQALKNQRWKDTLESFDENQSAMWKISKIIRNKTSPNCPIHGERGLVYDNEGKAEALADSLEKQCRNIYDNIDLDHIEKVHKSVRSRLRPRDRQRPPR